MKLEDFKPGSWSSLESQQHQVLWFERIIQMKQREARWLWMRVGYTLVAGSSALIGAWVALHGVIK